MTIDISGDVIYFDGRPVGFITVPNGSLRAMFTESIECYGPDGFDSLEKERDDLQDKIDAVIDYINDDENVKIDKIEKMLS